jgi:hypothetical protein
MLDMVPSKRPSRHRPTFRCWRMRWIQPYWKGPDIAAIIERTYKLKP